jgi:YbgC/YbaW family acyl-CoA thioester hydrolase
MNKSSSRWSAEAEIQVQFFDLDPMEVVWHGHYVKYLEVARCALLDAIDYNYTQMKASGYAWPVIDMRLRYIDSATFGQRLKLRAEIVEWENRLKIDYLITDAASARGAISKIGNFTFMKSWFKACGIALAAIPLLAAAPVAKIQSMLSKPNVLCGRFDQSKQLAGLKKPLASNGRFCVVADKGVLWRTLQPFPNSVRLTRDEIVHMQGDRVTMRLDAKHEPNVRLINSVLFALLAGDLGQIEKLFEIDGYIHDNTWKVTLKAREPALAMALSNIVLDGGAYVKNITISETSGDRNSIVFSEIQTGEAAMTVEEAALF